MAGGRGQVERVRPKRYDDHGMKPWIIVIAVLLSARAAFCGPAPELTVSCKGKQLVLTSEQLAKLPSAEADAADHQTTHHYSGVFVRDILGLVDAPFGDSLRGNALTLVVRVTGLDNYSVVFSLAEFDPAFNDRPIILAERQDGQPLPDNAAPFRLVIPGDQRPARWVRQIKALEVLPFDSPEADR
jgi:hypothetical protein